MVCSMVCGSDVGLGGHGSQTFVGREKKCQATLSDFEGELDDVIHA